MAIIAARTWRWIYKMGLSGCRWFGGLGAYLSGRKMALVGNEPRTIGPDSPTVLSIKGLFARPLLGNGGPGPCGEDPDGQDGWWGGGGRRGLGPPEGGLGGGEGGGEAPGRAAARSV